MSEDHIGVQINGVLYVKFEDAKKLREGWDEADAKIEKLRAENENLRKTIRDGIKLIDLDAVKSFRKTLKWALGEKE